MADDGPDRRKFLKVATCAIGGGAGLVVAGPVIRLVLDPATKQTVTSPKEPLDIGSVERFRLTPTRVELVAPVIQDAWTTARDVVLGAAWVRHVGGTKYDARSAICPHLGCAVGFDSQQNNYLCPCHDSRFGIDGAKLSGPSERGLDALPIEVVGGRLRLTWVQYKMGKTTSEPV